jgi:hypothetical protein
MRQVGEVPTAGPANQSPDGCGPALLPLGVTRGDDLRRVLDFLDAAGAPLPMGGCRAHVTIRNAAATVAEWDSEDAPPRVFLADGQGVLYVPGSSGDTRAVGLQPGAALWWDWVIVNQQGQRFTS